MREPQFIEIIQGETEAAVLVDGRVVWRGGDITHALEYLFWSWVSGQLWEEEVERGDS